jgi:hypothetical protein
MNESYMFGKTMLQNFMSVQDIILENPFLAWVFCTWYLGEFFTNFKLSYQ